MNAPAPTPDPVGGPWIWLSMINGTVVYSQPKGVVDAVLCPAWQCAVKGIIVDLHDGRIAPHNTPWDTPCSWAGVRVVADPELLERFTQGLTGPTPEDESR